MTTHPRLLPASLLPGRLLGFAAPRTTTTPPEPIYALGSPGQPSRVPTLLIADFDSSISVTSAAGTDPLSNRFAEVDRALSRVAKKSARHELGVVLHFDTPSSGEVGPLPLTRSNITQFRRGLCAPWDGAGTSRLGPSLRRAQQLAIAHPDHQVTLVVLSDFHLLDADRTAVMAELAAFPGTVHAVVLGGHQVVDMSAQVTVTNVRPHDPPGAVAQALFASLTRFRPGSRSFRAHNSNRSSKRPESS